MPAGNNALAVQQTNNGLRHDLDLYAQRPGVGMSPNAESGLAVGLVFLSFAMLWCIAAML